MKVIPNKVTTLEAPLGTSTQSPFQNYAALMKIVLNHVTPAGFSTVEMRKNFRLLDVIDAAGENISLEDADFEYFKSKLKDFRWNIQKKDLIAFEDDINSL